MDEKPENPYQAPLAEQLRVTEKPSAISATTVVPPTIAYTAIGCMVGLAIGVALTLSLDPIGKLVGGLMFGAPTGSLIGYLLGLRRSP